MDGPLRAPHGDRGDRRTTDGVDDLARRDRREAAGEAMTAGDDIVERGADKLDELAAKAAADGSGLKAKLADELADDAAFLRKLKPSLIAARARGRLPKDAEPGSGAPKAPSGAQLGPRSSGGKSGGPNPFAVIGGATALGVLLAKLIDWRGHAHPRR